MKVLFLTLVEFQSLNDHNIYTDLLRELKKNGHEVFAISPVEKRKQEPTRLIEEDGAKILRLQIGNTQKTNVVQKGISTLMIEPTFKHAIKKYFAQVRFDLVLYSTPPITLVGAIKYVKNRDNAKTYLLLKDIFPQNAVDIGMLKQSGLKGLIYKYFLKKEKELYKVSDSIGCMSQANVDYVLEHNLEVKKRQYEELLQGNNPVVEICPNSVDPIDKSLSDNEKKEIREKYQLPLDKKIFVYGGNLGKPQGIDFMLQCLKSQKDNEDIFFLIVGNGTEYGRIEEFLIRNELSNVMLHQWLPKEDYDKVVAACDVGLIFLDYRFTIPNFPSRLLSYMQAKLPVLAVTDVNTDIGNVITGVDVHGDKTHEPFGWWCESDNSEIFLCVIEQILNSDLKCFGEEGYRHLVNHYSSCLSAEIILRKNNY